MAPVERLRTVSIALGLGLVLLLGACGGEEDLPSEGTLTRDGEGSATGADSFRQPMTGVAAYPVFVSSEIVVGENRFLVGILNDEDAPIGSEDMTVDIAFYDLAATAEQPAHQTSMDFVPIDRFRGLYQAPVTFESAGEWGAEVTITGDGIDETVRTSFEVAEESTTPAIGAKVPASHTPTLDDVGSIEKISTDKHPIRAFYEVSVAEALKDGEPFVLIYATPKFCQTAACGPMLDQVKDIARPFMDDVTFIHVEPYDLTKVPNLQPIEAVLEWGLPSEPWVFVVDERGRLVSKYEGVLDPAGLRKDLQNL